MKRREREEKQQSHNKAAMIPQNNTAGRRGWADMELRRLALDTRRKVQMFCSFCSKRSTTSNAPARNKSNTEKDHTISTWLQM